MITYIKGRLCEKTPTSVVIEANGIGSVSYTHLTLPTNREV